jgi:hypothetical protein
MAVMLHGPMRETMRFNGQAHRTGHQARTIAAMEDEGACRSELRSPSRTFADLVMSRLDRPARCASPAGRCSAWQPPPPAPRARLSDLRFLYFGCLEPRQGVAELVEAFRDLPDLELTLIGSDLPLSPYGTSFGDHLRRRAPGNVRFETAMPRQELLRSLAEHDV